MQAQAKAKQMSDLGLTAAGGLMKPANPFKIKGTRVEPKSKNAASDKVDKQEETSQERDDRLAQSGMTWIDNMVTLEKMKDQDQLSALGRLEAKYKSISLGIKAQIYSKKKSILDAIQKAKDEATARNTEIRDAANKVIEDKAHNRMQSILEGRFIQQEISAMKMEDKGNQLGADKLRHRSTYEAGELALQEKKKQGFDTSSEMALLKAKQLSDDDKSTKDYARNIATRIQADREETEAKKKSVFEQIEAIRRLRKENIQWTNPQDVWKNLMVDSVRRKYGPAGSYTPGNLNGPISSGEVAKVQNDQLTEQEKQTTVLTAILNTISPPVHASEMLPNAY
jgi:hypothetical protein